MAKKKQPIKTVAEFLDEAPVISEDGGVAQKRLHDSHKQEYYLCATDFWYWLNHVKTLDEGLHRIQGFPIDYDGLQYLDREIENSQIVIILKARRQLVSWLGILRILHGAMFAHTKIEGTYDAFLGGIMTIGEREAKYLIKRTQGVYSEFPEWLRVRNPMTVSNVMDLGFWAGGTIQAFPLQKHGPRTFGFTRVLFDEMAFQEAVRTTWMGMIPTLEKDSKLLAVSTPNGRANLFYDVWSGAGGQYKNIKRMSVEWNGTISIVDGNKTLEKYEPKVRPHDESWLRRAEGSMKKSDFEREYLQSFASVAGNPVWPEYDRLTHVPDEIEVMDGLPILIGWDFGFHFPAATFWQYNLRDQYVGLREYEQFDMGFDKFAELVRDFANSFYDRRKTPEIHFIPPDGFHKYHSKSKSGAACDADEIRKVFGRGGMGSRVQLRKGSKDVGTRDNEGPRLKEVRRLWGLRADGNPGIVISTAMPKFIEGCGGSYVYPEKGGEQPEKNEASHLQDSFQCIVTGHKYMRVGSTTKQKKNVEYKRVGFGTGL